MPQDLCRHPAGCSPHSSASHAGVAASHPWPGLSSAASLSWKALAFVTSHRCTLSALSQWEEGGGFLSALSRNVGGERFHAPIQNSREHATTCPLSGRISVRPQRRRRRAESAATPRPQTASRGLQSRLWMQPAPHGSGTRAHSSTGRLQACLPLSGLRAG